jgi:hypothetical protein
VARAHRVVKKDFEMRARRYASATSRALYLLETGIGIRVAGRGESVMKKLLFGSVAFVALIAVNAASAADMGLPCVGTSAIAVSAIIAVEELLHAKCERDRTAASRVICPSVR